jgi:DNA-binding CsgD family transcriptional regulator
MGTVMSTSTSSPAPLTVEEPDGRRFVLVPEERYRMLVELERRHGVARPPALTSRELEILQMTSEGKPGAVVAERLGLAPNTVAQHLASVRRKYGVRSSAAAAALARQAGLLD